MNRRNLSRAIGATGFFLLLWFVATTPASRVHARPADEFSEIVKPFLAHTCYSCHNPRLQSGGVDLAALQTAASVVENRAVWERMLRKLRAGEMPPKSMPRPNETELRSVIAWIESELGRADSQSNPDPGRVTARRLNRAEYNNTVRDLLGINMRPADDFPQDDSGYGFDNIGDVLSLSPVLMEKYFASAERIARAAVFGPEQMKPTMVRLRSGGPKIVPSLTPLSDYDTTGLTLPNAIHITHRFPVEGDYLLRVFLGGSRPVGSEPFVIALWIDGRQVQTVELDPSKTAAFDDVEKQDLGGKAQEFRLRVNAGEHWIAASILRLYEGLPARYGGPNPAKKAPPVEPFQAPPGIPPHRVAEFKKKYEERVAAADKAPVNEARLGTIEIGGPYNQAMGPSAESLKAIYTCGHLNGHHQSGCGRKIIASLARRAYRRQVSAQEIDKLNSLVALARKEGDSFEEGICQSIQAMLVSPNFLFRIERGARSGSAQLQALSNYELASRLSYFLWSSMPDDELMRLADQNSLRKTSVLEAQVRRMLADARSHALVENFGGQWLETRKLESVKPDRQRFPDFDEYLRMSMRRETELFFESVAREDRSILDFIDSDYTFLNERLAQLYRIPGVKGPEFRKVALSAETQRGGVLTQAGILTISSYATRTSPVLRGKWILEKILNSPPPPPPADVPNLDETRIGTAASMRAQLEAHRRNPTCASCHARMDPLGFGLENFNAIGAFRSDDGTSPIDATGTLPDGRSFRGPGELKTILKSQRDAFAEGLVEKMLTYALGRGLESYDKNTVRSITARLASENYRFSSLVIEISKSLPFQMRRGDRPS